MATEVELESNQPISPEEEFFEAVLDSMCDYARQARAWALFGTIGFDAYKSWILANVR